MIQRHRYKGVIKVAKRFFAKVQDKMHYAVHGHTAAELIHERADAEKPHMGFTTWAAAPEGKVVKSDIDIEKNYLSEKEMAELFQRDKSTISSHIKNIRGKRIR